MGTNEQKERCLPKYKVIKRHPYYICQKAEHRTRCFHCKRSLILARAAGLVHPSIAPTYSPWSIIQRAHERPGCCWYELNATVEAWRFTRGDVRTMIMWTQKLGSRYEVVASFWNTVVWVIEDGNENKGVRWSPSEITAFPLEEQHRSGSVSDYLISWTFSRTLLMPVCMAGV